MRTRGLRLAPRDEDRLPAWRFWAGPLVLVLAALLFLALLAVGSEPLVHPGESRGGIPAESGPR